MYSQYYSRTLELSVFLSLDLLYFYEMNLWSIIEIKVEFLKFNANSNLPPSFDSDICPNCYSNLPCSFDGDNFPT